MSDFSFEVTKGGESIPAGIYQSEFVRIERYEENVEQYGVGLRLVFRITEGELEDVEASRIVSLPKKGMSKKTNLYKFGSAFNGGPLDLGKKLDFQSFIGTKGKIVVQATKDDGPTRVESFIKG